MAVAQALSSLGGVPQWFPSAWMKSNDEPKGRSVATPSTARRSRVSHRCGARELSDEEGCGQETLSNVDQTSANVEPVLLDGGQALVRPYLLKNARVV